MLFKVGDAVTSVRINSYNHAIPVISKEMVPEIEQAITSLGLSFRVHNLVDEIVETIHRPRELSELPKVDRFPIEDILITKDSYVTRESKALLELLGVRAFINESPKIFKTMYILMNEVDGSIFATNQLIPGHQFIDQVEGYFDKGNIFSCELGEYPIK